MKNVATLKTAFAWYRKLSISLIKEFPEEYFSEKLAADSLTISKQFADFGHMQLQIGKRLAGKPLGTKIPKPRVGASAPEIIKYLKACDRAFWQAIAKTSPKAKLNWFGRMEFSFFEAILFLIAHESLHHGEIYSFILSRHLEIPPCLTKTWGFEQKFLRHPVQEKSTIRPVFARFFPSSLL